MYDSGSCIIFLSSNIFMSSCNQKFTYKQNRSPKWTITLSKFVDRSETACLSNAVNKPDFVTPALSGGNQISSKLLWEARGGIPESFDPCKTVQGNATEH